MVRDGSQRVRESEGGEPTAFIKRIITKTDTCEGLRECEAGESTAVPEGGSTDAVHIVREREGLELTTVFERKILDAVHTAWERDGGDTAAREGTKPYGS